MSSEVVLTENDLPQEVIDAIRDGRKIEAIKRLRESKNLGLANAQVLVDKAWRQHGPVKEYRSFADTRPGLSLLSRSLGTILLVIAAYYFYTSG